MRFYRTNAGTEPVREWLLSLPKEDRAVIGEDIRTVEFGWPIGMPTCRHLGGPVFLPQGRIARVLFCLSGATMHLLHGFIKKTQKTPPHDLELAILRMRELTRHDDGKST